MASQDWRRQMEESNRRFYKNINEIRLQRGLPPVSHPSLRMENEENNRSIFIKIHLERYSISSEILDQVFSRFGVLESIEILSHPMGFHSKIRFENKESAIQAFDSLDGRNIYDNCCTLELFLMKDSATGPSDSVEEEPIQELELEGSEQETEFEVFSESSTPLASPQMVVDGNEPGPVFVKGCCLNFGESEPESTVEQLNEVKETTSPPKDINQEIDGILEDILVQSTSSMFQELKRCSTPTDEDNPTEPHVQSNKFEVNPNSSCDVVSATKELAELVVLLIELIEIRLANGRVSSLIDICLYEVELLEIYGAHQVFVKMPKREFWLLNDLKYTRSNDASLGDGLMQDTITISSNKGQRVAIDSNTRLDWNGVFDPGGYSGRDGLRGKMFNCGIALSSGGVVLVETDGEMNGYMVYDRGKQLIKGFVFDPGGIDPLLREQVAHQLVVSSLSWVLLNFAECGSLGHQHFMLPGLGKKKKKQVIEKYLLDV